MYIRTGIYQYQNIAFPYLIKKKNVKQKFEVRKTGYNFPLTRESPGYIAIFC